MEDRRLGDGIAKQELNLIFVIDNDDFCTMLLSTEY